MQKTTNLKPTVHISHLKRIYNMQHFNGTIIPKRGQAVISSGVNINLLNPLDFYVYEIEGKTINLLNPGLEDTKPKTCKEAVGYAFAKTTDERTFMLRVSNAVATKGVLVISSNQIWKAGIEVNKVPVKFHGEQKIRLNKGYSFFKLEYTVGMLVLNVWKPTENDVEYAIEEKKVIDLTPLVDWEVKLEKEEYF